MSLRYADWQDNDSSSVDFEAGRNIWNACLQACADHCRQFGEEIMEEQSSDIYIAMRCKKKLEELTSRIERAQSN